MDIRSPCHIGSVSELARGSRGGADDRAFGRHRPRLEAGRAWRARRPCVACALVAAVGFAVRRPLARVPENTLKFTVGVMLSAFGVFWTGEGLGVPWPGADLAILGFAALFLVAAVAAVTLMRSPAVETLP